MSAIRPYDYSQPVPPIGRSNHIIAPLAKPLYFQPSTLMSAQSNSFFQKIGNAIKAFFIWIKNLFCCRKKSGLDLVNIWKETATVLKKGSFISPNGMSHNIKAQVNAAHATTYYGPGGLIKPTIPKWNTVIEVINRDCLDEAQDLVKIGYKPYVLNMGSWHHAGGGYKQGARAQEEDLFRRTALSCSLLKQKYPLGKACGYYSPKIVVLRKGAQNQYAFLDQPFSVAFGTVAALKLKSKRDLNKGEIHATRKIIRTTLKMALYNGHDALVLSALGCGAYNNKPEEIAQLFKEALNSKEFKGQFRHVVFAILDDHNAGPKGNFHTFKAILG